MNWQLGLTMPPFTFQQIRVLLLLKVVDRANVLIGQLLHLVERRGARRLPRWRDP